MDNEWIQRQKDFLTDNITKLLAQPERLVTTSRKSLDLISVKNASKAVTAVHRSIKNTQTGSALTDSGSWIIFLYSVIFFLAVIGNLLVILTLIQSRRMRTITNLFLLNLAISDLFLGVFCMPFTLVGMLLRDFIFGELMCKLLPYLQGLFDVWPIENLDTMSFNVQVLQLKI